MSAASLLHLATGGGRGAIGGVACADHDPARERAEFRLNQLVRWATRSELTLSFLASFPDCPHLGLLRLVEVDRGRCGGPPPHHYGESLHHRHANLRVAYGFGLGGTPRAKPTAYLDVFHIGSGRTAVMFDQRHYFGATSAGQQSLRNPTYGQPTRYAPPLSARLGMVVGL